MPILEVVRLRQDVRHDDAHQHQRLVYGHATAHDCLAFADADTATEEAAEIRALAAARTWGEARQVRMTHLSNPAGPEYYEPEDGTPTTSPSTSPSWVRSMDGYWPPMVTSGRSRCCRRTCRTGTASVSVTVHNGEYLEIPVDGEGELVAELRDAATR